MIKSEVLDLTKVLIKSTATYIHKRIELNENKEFYAQGIIDSFKLIERSSTMEDLRIQLKEQIDRTIYMRKPGFLSSVNPRKYYTMALYHVLDIQNSIETRFVTGTNPDTKFITNGGIVLYEDESIFGHL